MSQTGVIVRTPNGYSVYIEEKNRKDGSIYKGWSGSKVTVTEKNGNIDVKQSVGTAIANGIANIGKFVQNIFLSEDSKKEYYGYYSKEEREKGVKRPLIDNMSAYEKQNNADNWRKFYSEVLK